jgi:uncharacterized iron-regulated membrane protein
MLRRILFWCHLIAGVSAGAVVLVMSVTGVALTYQKQVTEWADSAYWPAAEAGVETPRLPISDLVARASERFPGEAPVSIRFYSDPEAPALVSIGGESVYVHPSTGEATTGNSVAVRSFFRVMTDWHRWLADETRSWGRAITGASNLVFLVIVLSGACLWLPRNWSRASLRSVIWFRRGLAPKARDFNWHNVFGFWMAIPLILIVASGAVISYPWATNLVYTLTGTEAPLRGGGGAPGGSGPDPGLATDGLDGFVDVATDRVPSWRTITLTLPRNGSPEVSLAIDESFGGQPQSRSTIVIDRTTGRTLRHDTFQDQNLGQRTRSWLRFVHTGEYYGVVGQTLAGLASLAVVFLVCTGGALSLKRFLAWRRRSAA